MNRWYSLLLTTIVLLACAAKAYTEPSAEEAFEQHYKRATAYSDISLYGPCIAELNTAIRYARAHQLEEAYIRANISLAETMRKTHDFDKGLELLLKLKNSSSYPQLHVRKLGRMAALYSEWLHNRDSILLYLDSALSLAVRLNLKAEMASLYNEYGYTIFAINQQSGMENLQKSARLFKAMKDTSNYVSPMTNLLRNYLLLKDREHAEQLINELVPLLKNRTWYNAQAECYKLVARYYRDLLHDQVKAFYWSTLADKSTISYLESINNAQVNAFRTMYRTQMLVDQVNEMKQAARIKQAQLELQTGRTRELVIYLSLLSLLALIVMALLWRETKLKSRLKNTNQALQWSNEKYQVLMQESNHRIKNNLQMVISMLQYEQGLSGEASSEAFKRMSGKIQTVSALHKHLSVETHNELVPMNVYFREITSLYYHLSPDKLAITGDVAPVKINSERMVYFGLILNEMLANTIAHGSGKQVQFNVIPWQQGYRFSYCDSSVHQPSAQQGTGTTLIRQLIERVGGISFIFDASKGYYQFDFNE